MTTIFAFLHHVAAFTLVGALGAEFILIGQLASQSKAGEVLSAGVMKRLLGADAVLGVSAGAVLVIGLLRVFYFGKGADYYFHSHAFMTKFAVFLALALLSLMPTAIFLSWRKDLKAGRVPTVEQKRLRMI